ncbi:MAG: tRNA (adenosine(37)-N6)-threonylcarbamoyltransferase complex dimerization subunit type 1 TsaB [Bdellovibrionota bacterium]
MSIALAIDTSTKFSSIALQLSDGSILCNETESENSHDEELANLVQQTLSDADLKAKDIRKLIIGSGPGSFTGLRIGFSFMKGLASALGLSLDVLPTFHAAALASVVEQGTVAVLSDAKRSEWFMQIFEILDANKIKEKISLKIYSQLEVENLLSEHLVAEGACILSNSVEDLLSLTKNASKSLRLNNLNMIAKGLILLDNIKFPRLNPSAESDELELAYAEPSYLRAVFAQTISERAGAKSSGH